VAPRLSGGFESAHRTIRAARIETFPFDVAFVIIDVRSRHHRSERQ
jgi:hypothetical protein